LEEVLLRDAEISAMAKFQPSAVKAINAAPPAAQHRIGVQANKPHASFIEGTTV